MAIIVVSSAQQRPEAAAEISKPGHFDFQR